MDVDVDVGEDRAQRLHLEDDLGDRGLRTFEGCEPVDVDAVVVRARLDQEADDGVKAGEVVDDPLVGDDSVQRRVALVVHRFDVCARLHQKLGGQGTRESHDFRRVERVDGRG